MKLLAVSGSLRRDSHNTKLLRAAEELVPAVMEFQLWDRLKEIPPYDEEDDVEPAPPAVAAFRTAIAEADAILFSTPEYNSSIPGQLKNAIDWASRPLATNPLRNKPVAVVGASTGAFGAVWAQAELRKVLGATGARVVDADVALGHAHTKFDQEGELIDEAARDQLADVVVTLLAETPAPQVANAHFLGEQAREARPVAGNVVAA
jgi:chromate reductase